MTSSGIRLAQSLGRTMLVVVLFAIPAVLIFQKQTPQSMEPKGRMFALKVAERLFSTWDPQILLTQADQQFLQMTPVEYVGAFVDNLKERLGSFKSCQDLPVGALRAYAETPTSAVFEYHTTCMFERGQVQVLLVTVLAANRWKITGFKVGF